MMASCSRRSELVGQSRLQFDKVTATPDRRPVATRFELQRPEFYQSRPSKFSRPLLRALVNRDVVPPRRPNVALARTADLLTRILDHFPPLRDPAGGARHSE